MIDFRYAAAFSQMYRWPRVASILLGLADTYHSEAERIDRRADFDQDSYYTLIGRQMMLSGLGGAADDENYSQWPNHALFSKYHRPMADDRQPLEDLDATPEEKRLSRIAADVWGVDPVRWAPDGTERPLVRFKEHYGFKARLGDFGVGGTSPSSNEKSPEEDGWTPIWADQELPVVQNGEYKYSPERGEVFYEDGDAVYEDMPTALVKALDYEIHGPPPDRGDLSAQGV